MYKKHSWKKYGFRANVASSGKQPFHMARAQGSRTSAAGITWAAGTTLARQRKGLEKRVHFFARISSRNTTL